MVPATAVMATIVVVVLVAVVLSECCRAYLGTFGKCVTARGRAVQRRSLVDRQAVVPVCVAH